MITFGIILFSAIIAFIFFWNRVLWLWYALVFLSPFTGLILNFGNFGFTKEIPYINHINAPYADFVAIFLLMIIFARSLAGFFKGKQTFAPEARAVGWYFIWPFLFITLISVAQVDPDTYLSTFKYWLRPILFFYFVWIILPQQVVLQKQTLKISMMIFLSTGLVGALVGFLSLFFKEAAFGFLTRATPLGWGSFYPFGWNQNLLAEVLIATAPLAAYSMLRAEKVVLRKWFFIGFILIVVIALLTFSRAAWIALIVQGIIFIRFYEHFSLRRITRIAGLILLVLFPLVLYMFLFIKSPIVASSNATRFDLSGIAWEAFKQHPILGNGVGSFVPLVEETRIFTLEYGDPLDAHGVIQKLIAEVGLLGTIAFIVFSAWCLIRVWQVWHTRPQNSASSVLMACWFLSIAGSFVFQLFNTSYYGAHLWLPVGLALTAARLFETS